MIDPTAQNRVEELAAFFRQVVPLDETDFPRRLDDSSHSGMETGPTRKPDPKAPSRHPFEVYIVNYTSEAATTATVFVARGTVLPSEDDAEAPANITHLDTPFTLSSGERLWLHTVFGASGEVSSCTVVKGTTWSFHPALFKDNDTSGNEFITPIAQVRAYKDGKVSDTPDSGEFPLIEGGLAIVQKTHTHLAAARWCMGAERKLLWGLVPFSGGFD